VNKNAKTMTFFSRENRKIHNNFGLSRRMRSLAQLRPWRRSNSIRFLLLEFVFRNQLFFFELPYKIHTCQNPNHPFYSASNCQVRMVEKHSPKCRIRLDILVYFGAIMSLMSAADPIQHYFRVISFAIFETRWPSRYLKSKWLGEFKNMHL